MVTLTNSYQYIGRTNAVSCPSGWNYYILLYAKATGDEDTGKHTVTVKQRLACDRDSSFYGWATSSAVTVGGVSAFSWSKQQIPNSYWGDSSSLTVDGVTYPRWVDLKEGTAVINVGYGSGKTVTIDSSWVMNDSYSAGWFPYDGVYAKASITVTLPTIVGGASEPTVSASSVQMGDTVTITTNRNSTSFTHTLSYSFGGSTGTIATGVGASYKWTVPDLASKISNSTSGKCTITCVTYNGTTKIGSDTVEITLKVPDATTPELSASSIQMGNVLRVSVANKGASNFTHDVTYAVGDTSGTVYSGLKNYVDWTVPKSLAAYTAKKTSATCTITCVTYNGTAKVGTTRVTLTLTVPDETVPELSASTVVLGNVITISLPRETTAYVHDITMTLKAYGSSTAVRTATVATGAATSYGWTVPMFYAGLIPESTKGTITLTVTTRFADSTTEIGSRTVSFTVTVPNNSTTKPTISMELSAEHSLPDKFAGLYIRGKACVKAVITAVSDYSTVETYKLTVNGETKSGSSDTITSGILGASGIISVKGTAVDARGYSEYVEQHITVIPYSNPKVIPYTGQSDVVCRRCLSDGTPNSSGTYLLFKAGRRYSKVTVDGEQLNFCYLRYRYKVSTAEEYGSWQRLIAKDDVSIDEISVVKGEGGFDAKTSYTVQVNVYDDAGFGHTITYDIPTAEIDFHLKKNMASFGKYAERENAVEIADDWDLWLKGSIVKDHITETGTSGNWSYVYFNSGLKAAWYSETVSDVAFVAYGSVYRSDFLLVDPPPSPNATITALSYHVSGYGVSVSTWFGQLMFASAANPDHISFRLFTPSETTQNVRVRIFMLYR